MRKLLRWMIVLCGLFTFAIRGAIVIGRAQQPSRLVQSLRLFECGSMCWLGIQPGITTIQAGVQNVRNTYGFQFGLMDINGFSGERTLTPTFSGQVTQIIQLSEGSEFQSAGSITLVAEQGTIIEMRISSL